MDGSFTDTPGHDSRGAMIPKDISLTRFADGAAHLSFHLSVGGFTSVATTVALSPEQLADLARLARGGEAEPVIPSPRADITDADIEEVSARLRREMSTRSVMVVDPPPGPATLTFLGAVEAARLDPNGAVMVDKADLLAFARALAAWHNLVDTDDSSRAFEVVGPNALRAASLAAKAL